MRRQDKENNKHSEHSQYTIAPAEVITGEEYSATSKHSRAQIRIQFRRPPRTGEFVIVIVRVYVHLGFSSPRNRKPYCTVG
jgi:hypothetical protein